MIRFGLCLAVLAAFTAPAASQACSQISVSGQGHQGTMMTFALSGGAPNAHAMLGIAAHQGTTTFSFGHMGSLLMGLNEPILFGYMGTTGPGGSVQWGAMVPQHMPHRAQMQCQAFTMTMGPHGGHMGGMSMSFCMSNVAPFSFGGHSHMP